MNQGYEYNLDEPEVPEMWKLHVVHQKYGGLDELDSF